MLSAALGCAQPRLRATDNWVRVVGSGTTLFDGFGSSANVPANKAVECWRVFNSQIYAAVGQQESGTGNSMTVWRSSNLTNWTQVGASAFSTSDIDCFSMETDGTHLFLGTHASSGGANIYVTTDGSAWSLFNTNGAGYSRSGMTWASHMGILNGNLFAGILTTSGSGQVWKRPTDGSGNWAKVVDFGTGLGLPGGVAAPGTNAFYFYAISNIMFMPAGRVLYQSTDATGTSWVTNTQVGFGFGDINTLNLSSLAVLGDYLYAPTHNIANGGQLWRTPLTNALANGSQPWTKVVNNGFGQGAQITELHHITVGLGYLWISVQGPAAQVWRSADGVNWTQSNVDGFGMSNPVSSYKPMVEVFNSSVVWGGASGTNPFTGAEVWALGPLVSSPLLQIQPAGTDVQLSWPAGALDFVLETNTCLASSSWGAATNSVTLTNSQKVVTLKRASTRQFFRLYRP